MSADLKRQLITLLPRLRRFAQTLTRSVTEADDLVQEACLKVLAKSEMWDPTQPLDRWMFRVMRNLWISEIRKQKVRFGEGTVLADESSELVTTQTGEDSVAYSDLRGAMDALPVDLSCVLLLVSVEGYSYAETADTLDIPIGTVMSRVHRARKALAKRLAPPLGGAEGAAS
ncbi:MAG: RNA polymerase sigma factor [Pseudomonadota bacterium]